MLSTLIPPFQLEAYTLFVMLRFHGDIHDFLYGVGNQHGLYLRFFGQGSLTYRIIRNSCVSLESTVCDKGFWYLRCRILFKDYAIFHYFILK